LDCRRGITPARRIGKERIRQLVGYFGNVRLRKNIRRNGGTL